MNPLPPHCFLPSGGRTILAEQIAGYAALDHKPCFGDAVYGRVVSIGYPDVLEDKDGRLTPITDHPHAIYVYGTRYSPDEVAGVMPEDNEPVVDLLVASGVVGIARERHASVGKPTRIEILGYALDGNGKVLNTVEQAPPRQTSPDSNGRQRARMILNVGTSMNAGKTQSAVACCKVLASRGHAVRAAKVTGTAAPNDLLRMKDAGASEIADFSYLGWPSTYLIDEPDLIGIFERLDAEYGADPSAFWVVEFSDGILQRETAMLLRSDAVRSRIHRLIFSASDALGAIGGSRVLADEFGLVPDALSGRLTAAPLLVRELRAATDIPVFDNMAVDVEALRRILV